MRINIYILPFFCFLLMSNAFAYDKEAECTDCSCKACNLYPNGAIDRGSCVIINHQGAPLYETKDSPIVKRKLNFNDRFFLKNAYNNRVEVEKSAKSVGWVDKKYLHCGVEPLKYRNGLPMQFFIKTAAQIRDKVSFVKAYFSSDSSSQQFRKLYRFTRYFIVDEKDNRFLLAYKYSRTNEDIKTNNLVGWVEQDDGFVWDTACGLRPKDNLIISEGPKKGEEKHLFIYMSKDDAEKKYNGKPVLSGERWYKLEKRIPIIGSDSKYYKVVAPCPGIGVKQNQIKFNDEWKKPIGDDLMSTSANYKKAISTINTIDIFFLIDGTMSIIPYYETIQEVVREITYHIENEKRLSNISVRFGFGMYKDSYAKEEELSDWFSFSQYACNLSIDEMKRNKQQFQEAMDQIIDRIQHADLSSVPDLDFEENLFGGINKYINQEKSNCPDRLKILFIIGDHGYSVNNQHRLYNRKRLGGLNDLIDGLRSNIAIGEKQVVTFFIQTPEAPQSYGNLTINDYQNAYRLFSTQANNFLNELSRQSSRYRNQNNRNYFIQLNDSNRDLLPKTIMDAIFDYVNTKVVDVVDELMIDLSGGNSLAKTIEKYMGHEKYNDLPILFWDIVYNGSCIHLGDQCQDNVMDAILEGYIPKSEEWEKEIWLEKSKFEEYVKNIQSIVSMFENNNTTDPSVFTQVLMKTFERIINIPIKDLSIPLSRLLKLKHDLPVDHDSPLFRQSLNELEYQIEKQPILIENLSIWLTAKVEMLKIVQNEKKVSIERTPEIGGWYLNQPYIHPNKIKGKPFPKGMSYLHDDDGTSIYWVPIKFLP